MLFDISIIIVASVAAFISFKIIKNKRLAKAYQNSNYVVGWNGVFTGKYVSHWEVGRFIWVNDLLKFEKWGNPGNCCLITNLEEMGIIPKDEISFIGEIEDIGKFGHMEMAMFKIKFISWNYAT